MEVARTDTYDELHTGQYSTFRCLGIVLVAYGGEGLQSRGTGRYLMLRCLNIVLVAGEGYVGDYGWSRTELESQRQLARYSLNAD